MNKILHKYFSIKKVFFKKVCAYRGQSPGCQSAAFSTLSAMPGFGLGPECSPEAQVLKA